MKAKLHYVFSFTIFLFVFSLNGQNSAWKPIKNTTDLKAISDLNLDTSKTASFSLNVSLFEQKLNSISRYSKNNNSGILNIPDENGAMKAFNVTESSVFSPKLAAKFPNIKSYKGYALDGSGAQLTMSVSPNGVQTMISYLDKPNVFMQPLKKGSGEYVVYQKADKTKADKAFKCSTLESLKHQASKNSNITLLDEGGANNKTLQKFRIAISVTGEYTAYHGGTVGGALAGINATLARVNAIFEADMAITFELIDATEIIYTDADTDPYSDAGEGTDENNFDNLNGWSLQLQNTLTSTIGNAAYDIGHLFGDDGGGGFAGCIGCVCENGSKGRGFTSPPDARPEGDTFDLDYVIHEIGHQMGANHTWAFDTEGTGVNSEPGSGTTVMAYAGLQGEDNVATKSDPYFHFHSIKQILDNIATKSCQTTEAISNNPPSANAGSDFIIPAGTPYILKGMATDADGSDVLTYCWEQTDNGRVDNTNFGPTISNGSMNRSLPPSTSSDRYIPRLSSVLNGKITQTNPGLGSDWETASTITRTLNWALTVRDRSPMSNSVGQSSYDTMQVNVRGGNTSNPVGPFAVTSQATNDISWLQNSTETITWDVAGTDSNDINTSNVNILLSTDAGLTFDTVLITNTPNDGEEDILVPNIAAPMCRIMIVPVGNIYYAVNTVDFAIGYEVITTCEEQYASSENLGLSILDGQTISNSINVPNSGTISSIRANVDVSHSFISDLTVTLQHPNGTISSVLWSENCFRDSGYENLDVTFDDDAASVDCNSPTTGTFIPLEPLSAFKGLDNQGNWTISIFDDFEGDEGTLNDWSLEFCTTTFKLIEDTFVGFSVFPNPNDGVFNIKLNTSADERDLKLEVFDMKGRFIHTETFNGASKITKSIDLNHLQGGMYFLNLYDTNKVYTHKIVVK
ncbi:reprolysin-like metallopeptidase [Algibacter sp. 2305UL17-15]|uniref:zinc-dependent metalloprotease n=1 Tax=Algibacter sp. 2305UL17-15 TaxID=3231268 RepID=UPI00345876B2